MPEPISTTGGIVRIAAALSTITLALLGVDYFALLWGMVGALLALSQSPSMGRTRAIVYVILSTLVGAALGHGAQLVLGSSAKPVLILGSLVGGAGAQMLVASLIAAVDRRIKALGGVGNDGGAKS